MTLPARTLARFFAALLFFISCAGNATEPVGIVILHGKNPGGPNWQGMQSFAGKLDQAGIQVLEPEMPWSRRRYIDADFDSAMREIDGHVKALREKGAKRIVLAGHSMGCPAAMAYAARHGGVDALVLLAPGHVPAAYFNRPQLAVVRESIEKARQMVECGEGNLGNQIFSDINQGTRLTVFTTAKTYLSYFDPTSDAEMSNTAPRIPANLPVLWVIGRSDPLFPAGRAYVFDKLPANSRSRYLEVDANHLSTPAVASEQAVAWIVEALAK
jgi:pimeloyl-ACP methyl ester carboxylesterase